MHTMITLFLSPDRSKSDRGAKDSYLSCVARPCDGLNGVKDEMLLMISDAVRRVLITGNTQRAARIAFPG
jgi:hypothetical protein